MKEKRIRRHFQTVLVVGIILILATIAMASKAKKAYKEALISEQQAKWDQAVTQAYKAIDLEKGDYPDAKALLERVGNNSYEAHLKMAESYEKQGMPDMAVQEYKSIQELVAGCQKRGVLLKTINIGERIENAQGSAAEAHYKVGDQMALKGDHKNAAKEFRKVREFKPGYKDAEQRYIKERELGSQRMAILPFGDQSGARGWSDIVFNELSRLLLSSNPEFLTFLDRANLDSLMAQLRVSQIGLADDQKAIEAGKIANVQLLLIGATTNVLINDEPVVSNNQQFEYADCTQWNKDPKTGQAVCGNKQVFYVYYAVHKKTRSANMSAAFKVINTQTTRIELTGSKTSSQVSVKEWATLTSGDIKRLPSNIQGMINNQDREPTDANTLLAMEAREIAGDFSSKVLEFFK